MREQATPPCPAYRSWTWSGAVLTLALATSLLWYMFWVVMASIELDIKHIVNWYFFARFNLTKVPRTYEGLESVGYWTPLFVFAIFLSSCLVCPCRTYLGKVPPIIYTAVVLQNILLFIYMLLAGQKIISFFLIVFPIQLTYQLHNVWWIFLLSPTLIILFSYVIPCDLSRQKLAREPPSPSYLMCPKPSFFVFTLVLSLHLVLPVVMQWTAHTGCLPCGTNLSKKPGLIAHRGCGYLYPENTLLSFSHSSQIPGMIGLETDVQISYDGVPFLLHDPHTIRTTDVISRCPEVDPLANATWLNFTSGVCPLNRLNVGSWFSQELKEHKTDVQELPEFDHELLPSLKQFLSIAKERGMIAVFDVREPNVAHPYHEHYLNKSLKTILASGIRHNKVWWLSPQRRDWVLTRHPKLVQVTKTEDMPFEKFGEEKIKVVNDDWGTPLETIRQYQAANLTINMFFVDSSFAFNYAWCVGVHSVTTNNCKQLASLTENRLHQVCRSLQHSVKHQLWPLAITFLLCSVSCMTCFECIQRMKRTQNSSLH